MNQQERQLLDSFLDQLVGVGNLPKDPEAQQLIARAVARQPDAAYLLVQRAILLEQALEQAKAQIAQLQQEAQRRTSGEASFLGGGIWGRHPEPAEPASQSVTGRLLPPAAGAAPAQAPSPATEAPARQRGGWLSGGGGSFLGQAAATAAGVAGGAFLFQGLENLLGHHGAWQGQPMTGSPVDPVTINNYYGDSGGNALERDLGGNALERDLGGSGLLADDRDYAGNNDSDTNDLDADFASGPDDDIDTDLA